MGYREEFGGRLSQLCLQNSLTQNMLAKRMFKSQQTISKWLRGESQPSLEDVLALADVFGVSVEYLMTGYEHGALDIGRATGLSQRVIDDLIVWHTSKDAPGFVNAILGDMTQISKTDHKAFHNIVVYVSYAIRLKKQMKQIWAYHEKNPDAIFPPDIDVGGGETIDRKTVADGLIVQSGEIFTALVREYIEKEVRKYAPEEDNP